MIVSTARRVTHVAGKIIDSEDRRLIGQALVIALALIFAALVVAISAGIAVRAFSVAAG